MGRIWPRRRCCGMYSLSWPMYSIWLWWLQLFTNNFPHADIHQLIAPDLLHQLIKGTFKDHLVSWVGEYLVKTHGQVQANQILDDIDKWYDWFNVFNLWLISSCVIRIAAAPPFSGLQCFSQGRGFKQWTGNDSKVLMKVMLWLLFKLV